jgi:ABC-type Na+ efflux pump permease subunit
MKKIFRDKSFWIVLLMVTIVAASLAVLSLELFRLPAMNLNGVYLNSPKDKVVTDNSTTTPIDNDKVNSVSTTTSTNDSQIKNTKVVSVSVTSNFSPKTSAALSYLQNIEKIFNLKYTIVSKTVTINDLKNGQSTLAGFGFSFVEPIGNVADITNSQKIRGYMSTGLGIDLINSGNGASGLSSYSSGKLFCSIFNTQAVKVDSRNIEVRCAERE